jgi:hypothetical protein
MEQPTWKFQLVTAGRQLVVAVVTAGIILAVLIIGFRGETNKERELAEQTLYANLAQACVLALPVTERGRNENDVRQCFSQYNLQPPSLVHTEP